MSNVLGRAAESLLEEVRKVGELAIFAARTFHCIFAYRPRRRILVPQMYRIGVQSLPVVLVTGTFVGMIIALVITEQLFKLHGETASGPIVNVSVVAQLGPMLAAIILAGRVGGAMAAELGTMRVTEQIDALTSLGADPVRYLVVPRFLACVLLIPILTVFSDFMGVVGGWLVSVKAMGITEHFYWQRSREYLRHWEIIEGVVKSLFFGGLIGIICCYRGFHARQGARGVGEATTTAFVSSFLAILVANFFLTVVFRHLYTYYIPLKHY